MELKKPNCSSCLWELLCSEVVRCAVKDDTEVEVVTHSLSSLPISLWHMFFPRSDTALHNNVKKKKASHIHMHANCATMRGRQTKNRHNHCSHHPKHRTTTPHFTSHSWWFLPQMQPRVPELNFDRNLLALVSVNTEIRALVSHSHSFFVSVNSAHGARVLKHKISSPTSLCLFFLCPSPPSCIILLFYTSFPWPQGAVSYVDAGALL